MKVALLRVAIDSGSGGCQGPLFRDGTFEYVPIPDNTRKDPRTYSNTSGRYGRQLADYLPSSIRWRRSQQSMHVDPEFETFTYGDPTPPKAGLRFLEAGDLLVFYAGLEGWDFHSPPALYIIGYFDVSRAGIAARFKPSEVRSVFGRNAHVRHRDAYEQEKDRLVLVKGSSDSRLLAKAVCISEMGEDRVGKPLKVLSKRMQKTFGDFGGHISIQRSPTRWVDDSFAAKAASFVRSLE